MPTTPRPRTLAALCAVLTLALAVALPGAVRLRDADAAQQITYGQFLAYRPLSRAAPAPLPDGQAPTAVLQTWNENHTLIEVTDNGTARKTGERAARAFVSEPIPYFSDLGQYLQPSTVAAYQQLVERLNTRIRECAASDGDTFARFHASHGTLPQWSRPPIGVPGTNPLGTDWSECMTRRTFVPGTNPPVEDTGMPSVRVCEDDLATPQLDYDRCQPLSAHVKAPPRTHTPLERDRFMGDFVAGLTGTPTHAQLQAAYGDVWATQDLVGHYAVPDFDTSQLPPVPTG
jgi:hypothetical protein